VEPTVDTLIRRADEADARAADELFALLYQELHRLADAALRRRGSSLTLSPTTLLHEAYLSMRGRDAAAFPDRTRFLAYASRAMRGLVIDHVRRRQAAKRGRQLEVTLPGELSDASAFRGGASDAVELVQIGDALEDLAGIAPALAELVDLHFFCGFSFGEIAELRGVSERTVQRDWRKARLLLHQALLDDADS